MYHPCDLVQQSRPIIEQRINASYPLYTILCFSFTSVEANIVILFPSAHLIDFQLNYLLINTQISFEVPPLLFSWYVQHTPQVLYIKNSRFKQRLIKLFSRHTLYELIFYCILNLFIQIRSELQCFQCFTS